MRSRSCFLSFKTFSFFLSFASLAREGWVLLLLNKFCLDSGNPRVALFQLKMFCCYDFGH